MMGEKMFNEVCKKYVDDFIGYIHSMNDGAGVPESEEAILVNAFKLGMLEGVTNYKEIAWGLAVVNKKRGE